MKSYPTRLRLVPVLLLLVCGAAAGPVRPAVSLTTAAEEVISSAWAEAEEAATELEAALAPAELD